MIPQSNPPIGERVAVLESKFEEITTKLDAVGVDIKSLSSNMEQVLTRKIATDTRMAVQFDTLQQNVRKIEKKSVFVPWITGTLAAASASVLSFLIIFYVQHLK